MRILLVVNASASSVTARARVVIQKALSADHEVEVAQTSRRGHATRLAQGAAADGVDVVVALGGDGTLNEAANGLAGTDTALAALPGGSTNVFARTIGLPNDPIEATGATLEALARGAVKRVGLGLLHGRYFLFHVGVGFDAAVVEQVERRASLKRYVGHPLFIFAAVDTWLRHYDHEKPRFTVRHADGTEMADGYFTLCLNSNPYTYLGNRPFNVAPDATFDRALTLVTFRTLDLLKFLPLAASALGSGRLVRKSRHVDFRADVKQVTIEGNGPVPYQMDGDYLGDAERIELRHESDVLRLVLP